MLTNYLDFRPALDAPHDLASGAAVVGRTVAGPGLTLRGLATLRADGEWVRVGRNAYFGERSTSHIAHGVLGTLVGDDVTVGRYAIVHACTVEDGVVVGDGAAVTDDARIGAYALVAAGSLVPPRKKLPGGFLYQGNPVTPVRAISREEVAAAAHAIRAGQPHALATFDDLPPLDASPFVPEGPFTGTLHAVHGRAPSLAPTAYVAPTAVVVGDVRLEENAGVYYGCVVAAGDGRIRIGARTNIQDNTLLVTDARRGELIVGEGVTFGHNVRMGSGTVEDDALVGMAARVGDGVVVERGGCVAAGAWVEPGTVVKAGWIWAGRPARPLRELRDAERAWFAEGVATYVEYSRNYLAASR